MGYGTQHENNRRHYQTILNLTGKLQCWRCGTTIKPGDKWDLGHKTDKHLGGTNNINNEQPECTNCNRSNGAKLKHTKGARQW